MRLFLFVTLPLLLMMIHYMVLADNIPIDEHILHFDDVQKDFQELHFQDEDKIKPGPSVFEIVDKYYMSNGLGERWAVMTIKNTSAGKRLLKNDNIVATYANGDQSYAQNLDETLDGNEIVTKAVLFGMHKFPILHIETK